VNEPKTVMLRALTLQRLYKQSKCFTRLIFILGIEMSSPLEGNSKQKEQEIITLSCIVYWCNWSSISVRL